MNPLTILVISPTYNYLPIAGDIYLTLFVSLGRIQQLALMLIHSGTTQLPDTIRNIIVCLVMTRAHTL